MRSSLAICSGRSAGLALNQPVTAGSRSSCSMPISLRMSSTGWVANRWCELLPVPLSTVAQPRLEVGILAAQRVLTRPEAAAGDQRVLEGRLRRGAVAVLRVGRLVAAGAVVRARIGPAGLRRLG